MPPSGRPSAASRARSAAAPFAQLPGRAGVETCPSCFSSALGDEVVAVLEEAGRRSRAQRQALELVEQPAPPGGEAAAPRRRPRRGCRPPRAAAAARRRRSASGSITRAPDLVAAPRPSGDRAADAHALRRPPASRARSTASVDAAARPARARRVRERRYGERRIDRTRAGAPAPAPGLTTHAERAVVRGDRADRRVVRARRHRLPARVPALRVEQRVVEHEVAARPRATPSARRSVASRHHCSPVIAGSRAAHERARHHAVRAGRRAARAPRSRSGTPAPNASSAASAVSSFCVDAGTSARRDSSRTARAPLARSTTSTEIARRPEAARTAALARTRARHARPARRRAAAGALAQRGRDAGQQQHASEQRHETALACGNARHRGSRLTRRSLSVRLRARSLTGRARTPMHREPGGRSAELDLGAVVLASVATAAWTGKLGRRQRTTSIASAKSAIDLVHRPDRRDDPVPRRSCRSRARAACCAGSCAACARSCAGSSRRCRPITRRWARW